jgi:hypothetical protein
VKVFFGRGLSAACLVTSIASPGLAQADFSKIQKNKEAALQLLEKIENGRNPCYTDECQNKKVGLLGDVFQISSLLPEMGGAFLPTRERGIDSGYTLVRKRFVPPSMKNAFPSTLKEWKQWWLKRSDHESKIRSDWMRLVSEIYSLQQGLRMYIEVARGSEEQHAQIEEAWQRGLARAAELLTTYPRLVRDASMADAQNDKAKAAQLRKEASLQIEEFNSLNRDKFENQFYPLLQALIPQAKTQEQVVAFLILTQRWMNFSGDSRHVFDPSFINELKYRYKQIVALTHAAQDFNDLEYGVVGIKNFFSEVNPAIRTELELVYQGFLDTVDETARQIVDIGSLYLLSMTGTQLFGAGFLGQYAFPTGASLLGTQFHVSANEILWAPSTRTEELKARHDDLEADMERRRMELFESRKALQLKIAQYDLELKRQTQGDPTP